MIRTRTTSRAAALLAATALAGGVGVLGGPATAAGNHTVSASLFSSGTWNAYLDCTTSTGTHLIKSAPMTSSVIPILLISVESISFSDVPDGNCSIQAVRATLPAVYGTASALAFPVSADVSKSLSVDTTPSFACSAGPLVTGTPSVGGSLNASQPTFTGGVPDAAGQTFTWYRSGQPAAVQASSKPSYTPTQADVGHTMSVVTSGRMIGLSTIAGLPSSLGAATCAPVSSPTITGGSTPTPTAQPQITGKPIVGHVIKADPAVAPAGATITGYQWYVKRVVRGHQRTVLVRIKGAHHRSLRMKERLAGKHVLVGVTYTTAGSTPTTVYSKALKVMKERMKE